MSGYPTPEEHGERIWDLQGRVSALAQALDEYRADWRRAIGAVTEVMATLQDVDDAKHELRDVIAEATATPFTQEHEE